MCRWKHNQHVKIWKHLDNEWKSNYSKEEIILKKTKGPALNIKNSAELNHLKYGRRTLLWKTWAAALKSDPKI